MIRTPIITVSYNSAATIRDTITRALYEKYGKFGLQFTLSADFDLILPGFTKFRLSNQVA